ncbi:hypothetical protein J1N35_044818 [Gossypium stocksii]|uniref:Uncharacterized protein n=1 Tax=Gossypium stocksii TaxID=47602 RepID=A0A9D3ZG14_9ROSI|nr:hypothetical protein J1N35_044818 [Gossypium stocksii]
MFVSSMEYTTATRHSVSGWDMHLGGLMFDARKMYWGMASTFSGWQSKSDWRRYKTSTRRDDVLPMTSTSEGISYVADDGGSDDESDVDPPREPSHDGAEVVLFFEPKPVLTEPEDVEGDDALEFPDLPHRRRDHTSLSLDSGELEVGKEFSNKDSFLGALKQHSVMNGVNYNMVKSKFDKFEAKCAVQDACQNLRLDPISYVYDVYKIEYMYNLWRHIFSLVSDERVLIVSVGRMTHLDRIKNAEVFASPTVEVFESHKAMGIGNKKSSRTAPSDPLCDDGLSIGG